MNNTIDISRLIDNRNEDWFNAISASYKVSFENSYNGEHSVYTIDQDMTFYIPMGVYCVDSFTHELLHGYMDACEVNIGGNLKNKLWQSNLLKRIFDNELVEHVANSISHSLMLPLFLDRGFNREKFLFDYHTYKAEPGLFNQLQKLYKQGSLHNLEAVNMFIGKYFACLLAVE